MEFIKNLLKNSGCSYCQENDYNDIDSCSCCVVSATLGIDFTPTKEPITSTAHMSIQV